MTRETDYFTSHLLNQHNCMHVAHLISSSGLYGAERWVLALIRGSSKYPVKFSVVNLIDSKATKSSIVAAATNLSTLSIDFYTSGKFNPLAGFHVGNWAKKNNVDIFHTHGYKSDAIGLIAAKYAKRKIIATPHGWSSAENDLRLNWYEKFDRFLFSMMDYVCPLSKELYSNLAHRKLLRHKLKLILNGVDIKGIDSIEPSPRADPSAFVIGYIGRLVEGKNITVLLDATKILLERMKNIRLLVVGDGDVRLSLERRSANLGMEPHVTFTGFRSDSIALLKSMDALILPSLSEGIPRCVMEAMAARVPVVVSDIPGNRNLVINEKSGLLFSPDDKEELVRKIELVMGNKKMTRTMVDNARELVEQCFSGNRMAKEYHNLYSYLMRSH